MAAPAAFAPAPGPASLPGALSPAYRAQALRRLRDEEFDVLVVGAGATGCGAALDAASRGLRVALVEQRDVAAGTSSRSSKLVHGGLRYLEQFQFGLVREALRERELLLTHLAPHLVRPVSFLYPLQHLGWERPYVGAGIALYEMLGGGRSSLPRHWHYTRRGARRLAPALDPAALVGGVRYFDGQMDDARLNVAIARTAAELGATVTTGTPVVGLLRRGERIAGAVVEDEESGERIHVRARVVLGCVGVWTDELYRLTGKDTPSPLRVRASKGVHIAVPREAIDADTGLILRTERSVLFVIPWDDVWLVGTTDTEWTGDLDEPAVTSADVEYLLAQANTVLSRPLQHADVVAVYAGLRPLVDSGAHDTARVSREHVVSRLAPGLLAIAGGKWTTYRVMARDAVDEALRESGVRRLPASRTDRIELTGARGFAAARRQAPALAESMGLSAEAAQALTDRYGAEVHEVLTLLTEQPRWAQPLAGAPEYLAADVVHACRFTGARHLADVLDRRLRLSLLGPVAAETVAAVAGLMAQVLGWDKARTAAERRAYDAQVAAMAEALTKALDTDADAVLRAARENARAA